MSNNIDLNEFTEKKLDFKEEYEKIAGKKKEFPTYTRQIINIANQNAQGTRPEVVGKMSELTEECPDKTYDGWKKWYLERYPDAIDKATNRIKKMIEKMRRAAEQIDEEMIRNWVEDLVIDKTAEGFTIQEIILKTLAKQKDTEYRVATAKEESRNIDG